MLISLSSLLVVNFATATLHCQNIFKAFLSFRTIAVFQT